MATKYIYLIGDNIKHAYIVIKILNSNYDEIIIPFKHVNNIYIINLHRNSIFNPCYTDIGYKIITYTPVQNISFNVYFIHYNIAGLCMDSNYGEKYGIKFM